MSKVLMGTATAALAVFVIGCGNSNDNESAETAATTATAPAATATTAQPATASAKLTVRMSEFAFTPKDAVAKAGEVTVTAPNDGNVVHELVILKTSADPAKLPMDGDEVDESKNVGEVADVAPGTTKSAKIKLAAGTYAMVCNLPGHYKAGMYGSLTVK
jgi:uncharacterized cupredoxin-like copper-binding protein